MVVEIEHAVQGIGGDHISSSEILKGGSSNGSLFSYKDVVNQKGRNWEECFKNWGINDIEEELMLQEREEGTEIDETEKIPAIQIDAQTRRRIIQPWKNCLIGKVVGKTVGYKYIATKTHELWCSSGKVEILDLGNDYFLFKFEQPEDFKHALLEGPWFVNRHHLAMMRWTANFKPSESSINRTVVWIRLPELPPEYYDEKILFEVAGKLGRPIKIDKNTELVMRGRFARLCVEVDTNAPLKSLIRNGQIKQKIEYEGIHLICFNCGKISHKKENCPLLQKANDSNVGSSSQVNAGATTTKEKEGDYGPWMLVQHKRSSTKSFGAKAVSSQKTKDANGMVNAKEGEMGSQWKTVPKAKPKNNSVSFQVVWADD
ncbi:uncharacterized protein LOC113311123 isoform X2 [Papaver somniferum]|uniref:uncharacterized protein LOC113311123 isoform X2 n=1 Tax=Papaver somniferum TaxID=3469 RepID=UPI000E700493|nr:uncharacterized protein LOC113311123 isoform X2 [Papaver somniferum]